MSIYEKIEDWIVDAETQVPQQGRKKRVRLYGEGVKSKLQQAEYSLKQISILSNEADDTVVTTGPEETPVSDRIGFYCDAFWAFLYSSLDILAQVINQSLKLRLSEQQVDFAKVAEKLDKAPHKGTPLQKKVDACNQSRTFQNIKKYRNCSTHRRQIYIEERVVVVRVPTGYRTTTTGPVESIVRIICDNPLEATPHINQSRTIPGYMEDTQTALHKHVMEIIKKLEPI